MHYRIHMLLALLAVCCPQLSVSDAAFEETENLSVNDFGSAKFNANIDEAFGGQTCSPTPDFIGQDDVLTTESPGNTNSVDTTTLPSVITTEFHEAEDREIDFAYVERHSSGTSILQVENKSSQNIDASIIDNAAEFSSELQQLKTEMENLSATVKDISDTFYASIRELNSTLETVKAQQNSFKQEKGRQSSDDTFSASLQMVGPDEVNISNGCPYMFERFWGKNDKGTCLWFSNITGSWAEALIYCRLMASDLAILNNWGLHGSVSKYMLENVNGKLFYLGGTDYQSEGHWRWLKPKKFFPSRRQFWKKGQPDNRKNAEHCLAIGRYSRKYKWTDIRCDRRLNFICQRKPADVA